MSNCVISSTIKQKIILAIISTLLSATAWADSPPNISTDIKWTYNGNVDVNGTSPPPATYGSVAIIEAAFNNARRQEETQLSLANGTIANLDLPSQTVWDGMSDDQKALYILNVERTSRAGIQPGVLGLPFAGVDSEIDAMSDTYTTVLINNDATGHNQPSGLPAVDGIFAKIDASAALGNCHSDIARGENIAWFGVSAGNSIPLPIERAIYRWIYDDSSSNWEHREMALLQDQPLVNTGVPGFNNDYGVATHEGYIGFSSKGSSNYDPFLTPTAFSQAIVMHFFDPTPLGGGVANNCAYTFTVSTSTENLPTATTNSAPVATNDSVTTAFNTATASFNVTSNDLDSEGDSLTVSNNTNPSSGGVVRTGNSFVYTPNTGFSGSDSFSYTLSDGTTTDIGTVLVTVNAAAGSSSGSGGGSFGFGVFFTGLFGLLLGFRRQVRNYYSDNS
jgi:hypothetical protein